MSWIGTDGAVSPPNCTLAETTGPHSLLPSPKVTQSARSPAGLVAVTGDKFSVTSEPNTRRPKLPVSTRISLMVWQVEGLPGSQIVTLVQGSLGYWLVAPPLHKEPFTVTSKTFTPDGGLEIEGVADDCAHGSLLLLQPAIASAKRRVRHLENRIGRHTRRK